MLSTDKRVENATTKVQQAVPEIIGGILNAREKIGRLVAENKVLTDKLLAATTANAELQTESASEMAEQQQRLADSQRNSQQLRSELDEKTVKLGQTVTALSEARNEVVDLKRELAEANTAMAEIQEIFGGALVTISSELAVQPTLAETTINPLLQQGMFRPINGQARVDALAENILGNTHQPK
jgi:septal ring factor EnvC (AmiA/AmiB activator)